METSAAYVPIDRRLARRRGVPLPEHAQGAALFADISGFTPLTEALAIEFGPRRGAEEMTAHLNRIYTALIAELYRYGGSIIGFAGDGMTCWLDGDDGRRAVAAGLAMQAAMGQFGEIRTRAGRAIPLSVKVGVAVGPVRRFTVGASDYLLLDTMVGHTLEHMAAAEEHAERGDVVLDNVAWEAVRDIVTVREWREDEASGHRFAVVTALNAEVPPAPWPDIAEDETDGDPWAAWLLPAVRQRLSIGEGEFLAELRPAVALFLRFSGIDYDDDPDAPEKLNRFVSEVQGVLHRYDGSFLQLTIGDKGSYLYAAFGAPVAHEDDAARACAAAIELEAIAPRLGYLEPLQIGITQGRMRTGAYGGRDGRTYGVLGDVVNLSARLMAAAPPGQILVSELTRSATGDAFTWESMDSIRVKGKSEPVAVSRLTGRKASQAMRLQEPRYRVPMVGRVEELAVVDEKLHAAQRGQGQIVGITAEAGMGKSRLAAEVIRRANDLGLSGLAGECQSYGTNTSYLVWRGVWRSFFGVDSSSNVEEQIASVEAEMLRLDPALAQRLPLLEAVLNVPIPDNDLTASLDARTRKAALEGLLVECLRARARTQPLLIVLEDCHWLDPLSTDLIGAIGRAIADSPVLLLLVYRPRDRERQQPLPVEMLPYFTELTLASFSADEAARLIDLKLRQFFGEDADVPADVVAEITDRAAGNPFYIEEILNYLRSLDIDPRDVESLRQADLPTSIYSLILARIDRLDGQQQVAIRVASVIGRLFPAAMLWGVSPELRDVPAVRRALELLSELELTPLDTPDPELTYLFKHIMTQQVAYETLPYGTRAMLHGQIGQYVETTYTDSLDRYLDLLAFHYDRSANEAKRREYLLRAGVAAQAAYANASAMDYYTRVLPLLGAAERPDTLLRLGQVLDLVGDWERAEQTYRTALAEAQASDQTTIQTQSQFALGELKRKQSDYSDAAAWYDKSLGTARGGGDLAGVARAAIGAGTLAAQRGDYAAAMSHYDESLSLRRQLNDSANIANVLNNMGIVARFQGEYTQARALHQQALAIRREIGDKRGIGYSLINLGNVELDERAFDEAGACLKEALTVWREIGDRYLIANTLNNLANLQRDEGNYDAARESYRESLFIDRDLGDRWSLAYLLEDIGCLAAALGQPDQALRLAGAGDALRQAINAPLSAAERNKLDGRLGAARQALGDDRAAQSFATGRALTMEQAIEEALRLTQ
ncbi:MAG: tetratricopeptide repeat protein [Anaerolineae bacterium]